MTDIFFSYKSDDRERVRLFRDAFVALGFDVFWDQQVPAGVDWDTWIRRHLSQAKCAVVFWSTTSVTSDNVRHEATVAKQQNKLVPVLLEHLTAEQYPIGLYAQQGANLVDWNGDFDAAEWQKLRHEVETKLTPPWMRHRMDELEAELLAERARREGVERRDKVLQAQIAKEARGRQELKRERDSAVDKTALLEQSVHDLTEALSDSKQRLDEMSEAVIRADSLRETLIGHLDTATARVKAADDKLYAEREKGAQATAEVAALTATVQQLRQALSLAQNRIEEAPQRANAEKQRDPRERQIEAAIVRLPDSARSPNETDGSKQPLARPYVIFLTLFIAFCVWVWISVFWR